MDTFCPMGPAIATGLDPATLTVTTRLNGEVRQNYPISDMRFSVERLVSLISFDLTLHPGDVILCGTSVGVGSMKARQPGRGRDRRHRHAREPVRLKAARLAAASSRARGHPSFFQLRRRP
jgi:2-keto-4-pentenoate hydratase/2-oxohepta-3-ene-1,7-dioic acid hydratase in catechol pathway